MQDFAAELRVARAGRNDTPMKAESEGGSGTAGYYARTAFYHGFEMGFENGWGSRSEELVRRAAYAREAGFDDGARTLLRLTLEGLQEVAGELQSRRAHKVMLERTNALLSDLLDQLAAVANDLVVEDDGQMSIGPL